MLRDSLSHPKTEAISPHHQGEDRLSFCFPFFGGALSGKLTLKHRVPSLASHPSSPLTRLLRSPSPNSSLSLSLKREREEKRGKRREEKKKEKEEEWGWGGENSLFV